MRLNKRFLYGVMAIFYISLILQQKIYAKENNININLFEILYEATYEGEMVKGIPQGKGSARIDTYECQCIVNGEWNKGVLNGNAEIIYENKNILKVTFENGLIDGEVKEILSSGEYNVYKCKNGKNYGTIRKYSSKGELIGKDWFYETRRIDELKEEAQQIEYSNLLKDPESFLNYPILVNGVIESVYDSSEKTYLKIRDYNGKVYIGYYKNVELDSQNQSRVPNFFIGEEGEFYGVFQKVDLFLEDGLYHTKNILEINKSDEIDLSLSPSYEVMKQYKESEYGDKNSLILDKDFYNTVPQLELFYAEKQQKNDIVSEKNVSKKYKEMCEYPYWQTGEKQHIEGIVRQQIVNYADEKKVFTAMLIEGENNEWYYCVCDLSIINDVLPIIGDTVDIIGKVKGNYKALSYIQTKEQLNYVIMPRISVSQIEKVNGF